MTATNTLPPEFDAPGVVFWEIAAEPGGAFWPVWKEQGIVSIGWNEFGDLARFKPTANGGPPQEYIAIATNIFKATDGRHGSYQAWTFARHLKPGHVVFARSGWDGICGVGVVTGDYRFVQPPLVAGPHRHAHVFPVRWLPDSGRAYPPSNRQRRTVIRLDRDNAVTRWNQDQYQIPVLSAAASPLARNIILYGPPGTGKTWSVKSLASRILTGRDNEPRAEVEQRWRWAIGAGRVEFVTFHPGMTYEEFVEGLKPVVQEATESQGRRIAYRVEDGVFKRIALRAIGASVQDDEPGETPAEGSPENVVRRALDAPVGTPDFRMDTPFILVLDEINRGNVSQVLGELITLIEEDKRLGSGDEQRVTLPASGQTFAVPPNLYVIGTMNTADRSIALLDVALRRRFTFQEQAPSASVLADMLRDAKVETPFASFVVGVFKRLNDRLSFLLDRDHLVGHAWFRSATDILALRQVFADRVIPLLQEYFNGDPDRLAIALGHPFQHSKPVPNNQDEGEPRLLIVRRHTVDETFGAGSGDLEDVLEVAVHPAFVGSSTWLPPAEVGQDESALGAWLMRAFEEAFPASPESGEVT